RSRRRRPRGRAQENDRAHRERPHHRACGQAGTAALHVPGLGHAAQRPGHGSPRDSGHFLRGTRARRAGRHPPARGVLARGSGPAAPGGSGRGADAEGRGALVRSDLRGCRSAVLPHHAQGRSPKGARGRQPRPRSAQGAGRGIACRRRASRLGPRITFHSLRGRSALGLMAALLAAAPLAAQTVGQPLPRWTPGTLDIHQINTGRGNVALLVLPDGTSLLLDAGDGGNPPPRGTAPRPDGSRPTAEWIARYVRALGVSAIDYGYLTHFHDDHMNAIVDVAARVPIKKMFDRGWPDYGYPAPDYRELQGPAFLRYREWITRGGVQGERLRPGRSDQIVLVKDAKAHPRFEVRNVAANGEVWTGEGTETRKLFPPLVFFVREDAPTENMC